jgi:hypothetical protein
MIGLRRDVVLRRPPRLFAVLFFAFVLPAFFMRVS